jgi:hypothetical protein
MDPTIVSALAGTSGLIGLLAILAYFFYSYQVRKLEQSVRGTIEGESPGLFNAEKVVDILRSFDTPESRLDALKQLIGVDDRAARRVYDKIEGSVNLGKWTDQDPKKRARTSLLIGLFFVLIALIGLIYSTIAYKPSPPIPSTPTPAFTPTSPLQTPTQSPSPPTTPLSQQEIQSDWKPIIYYVLNSKLVESYVPDNLHPTDLVEAIRDNANLQDLIKNFEGKVTDNAISGRWFTSIDNTLDKIQQDLKSVDRGVAQSPELLRLYPQQRNQLQTAEYARTQLLGLITQVSLQLGMSDPGFPNNTAKVVSTSTSSSSPMPTLATPIPSPLKTATITSPTTTTRADINATKHPEQGHGFDHGYASTGDCSGPWVRGDARLEPNGTFVISMELETNSLTRGAAGWLSFQLLDDKGNTLASGETDRQSIGPKSPGQARVEQKGPWRRQIPQEVADKVKSIEVAAHCENPPWGLGPLTGQDVQNGIKLIITAAGS